MRNHFHLIAVPEERESVCLAMTRCLSGYAQWFNGRHGSDGELWHRRLNAPVVSPQYFWESVRYVERNPVRAGIVRHAQDYPWSSAAYHCGVRSCDPLISPTAPLKGALGDWSEWLREPDIDGRLAFLRRQALGLQESGPVIGVLENVLDQRIGRRGKRGAR